MGKGGGARSTYFTSRWPQDHILVIKIKVKKSNLYLPSHLNEASFHCFFIAIPVSWVILEIHKFQNWDTFLDYSVQTRTPTWRMGRIPWKRKWSNHTIFERSRRVGNDSRRGGSEHAPLKSYGASKLKKHGPASPLILDRRWRWRLRFQNSSPWFLAIVVESSSARVFTFYDFGAAFSVFGGALEWRPLIFSSFGML